MTQLTVFQLTSSCFRHVERGVLILGREIGAVFRGIVFPPNFVKMKLDRGPTAWGSYKLIFHGLWNQHAVPQCIVLAIWEVLWSKHGPGYRLSWLRSYFF